MSRGPRTVTQTTSNEPPAFLRGPLTTAANAAESAFLRTQPGGIPPRGPGIVPSGFPGGIPGGGPRTNFRDPLSSPLAGQADPTKPGAPGTVGGAVTPNTLGGTLDPNMLISGGQDLIGQMLRGDFLSPESNPFLQDTFNRAADLTRTRLSSEFAGAGRDLGASFPARSEELQTLASNIFGQNFQAERDRQINALTSAIDFDPLNQLINRLGGIIPGAGGVTTSTQPVFRTGLF